VRGSEGGQEDWKAGRESMLAMDREMVLGIAITPQCSVERRQRMVRTDAEAIAAIEQVDGPGRSCRRRE